MDKIRKITYSQAICEAMTEEMERDENVMLIGYECANGGTFKCSKGMVDRFGSDRIIDAPISESGEIGLATGAAFYGMRPIVEIMMADFSLIALDPIVMHMAKFMYMSAGQIKQMPTVIRLPVSSGASMGPHHSQAMYAAFANFPGLKMVFPTNPYDAKGMLKAAIRDNNPVLFFEPVPLYAKRGEVPEGEYTVPLDKCAVLRSGKDLTIAACGFSVPKSMTACAKLEEAGISAEMIDIRSIKPLDLDTIIESVKRTGRLLLVDEGHGSFGITGEIAFQIMHTAMPYLKGPVERVTMPDVTIPVGPTMEKVVYVSPEQIVEKAMAMMKEGV